MLRLYAGAAAVALLVCSALGFSKLWGFDPLTGFLHTWLGVLFTYTGFFQRDTVAVRELIGGLGVLLVVVGSADVLFVLVAYGRFEHGPFEVTSLVLGAGSILAARYLPGNTPRSGPRRDRRRMP